jgi:hypothetical protein
VATQIFGMLSEASADVGEWFLATATTNRTEQDSGSRIQDSGFRIKDQGSRI